MKNATLADRIAGFSKIRLGKATVKVPKLRVKVIQPKPKMAKKDMPISSIVNILIKNAVEKTKKEKKDKPAEEDKSYKVVKDGRELEINGGYGAVSKSYGMSPKSSYADYGKLFSHIGSFRAKQPYDGMAEHVGALNRGTESGSFVLADKQTMEKGAGYIKYFLGGTALNPDSGVHPSSLVPVAGMSSAEWEEFKMWMKLDPVMYLLKTKIS